MGEVGGEVREKIKSVTDLMKGCERKEPRDLEREISNNVIEGIMAELSFRRIT